MARFTRTTFFPMVEFQGWLRDHGIASTTIAVYTSLVRRFFRAIKWDGQRPISPEEVQSFDALLPLNSMGPWRTGWRHLAAHAAERGIVLPVSFSRVRQGKSKAAREERAQMLREARKHPLGEPLWRISKAMHLAHIPDLTWAKIEPGNEIAVIRYEKEGKKIEATVPQKAIDALREWGKPTAKTDPLVPAEPGSLLPMLLKKVWLIKDDYANGFVDFTGKPIAASMPSEGPDESGKV